MPVYQRRQHALESGTTLTAVLPDVNVRVYAHREDSLHRSGCRQWVEALVKSVAYAPGMKILLLGLLHVLGAWLVLATVMTGLIQHLTGAPVTSALAVGLLAGGLALPAFGLLLLSWKRWRERATITAGAQGRPPADGRSVVLAGVLQATGPLLKAPLDGSPCVTYSYDIKVYRGTGKMRSLCTVARGVAMTPSLIVTPAGRFKLLVVPDLDATSPTAPQAECINNFVAYARSTPFIVQAKASAQELLDRWGDDDGEYRSDVAYEPLQGADTHGWMAQQQRAAPGAKVCVIGRFDQARGGVVPSAAGTPTRLIVGDATAVAASLRKTALWHAAFGVVLAAAPAWLLWSTWQASIPQ